MGMFGNIKHKKTALFLAGAIASLGFPPVYALPLFVAGLFFALWVCTKDCSYIDTVRRSYWFGVGFFCAGFYWISNALLIDINTFGFLYPVALASFGLFFGLFLIPPFVAWRFFEKTNVWYQILGFSSVFVLTEYVRSFLFTGFPWNLAGTMFAFSDILVQTASLIGTYGLSFVFLICTFCLLAFFKKYHKSAVCVFCLILCAMFVFGFYRLKNYDSTPSEIKGRIVQPSIPQRLKWDQDSLEDNLENYINMSTKEGFEDVKFVVWGETATPFNPSDLAYYRMIIKEAIPKDGYLMTGALRYDRKKNKLYNTLVVLNDQGETIAFYDKHHLVPFGEYLPFRRFLPEWIKPIAAQMSDFSAGEKYKKITLKGLPAFGALICYEVIFPDAVLNRKDKPDFIVLVSNDGWYGQSSGPYQHLVAARMRALEEGITIIRSANNGISALINPLGQTVAEIPLNKKSVLDFSLPKILKVKTCYASVGAYIVPLLMLILFLSLCFFKFKFYNTKKKFDFCV